MRPLIEKTRPANLLPFDGTAIYFGCVLDSSKSSQLFERLMESIEWKPDEAFIMGKRIVTKRMVAWYGDRDYLYKYSGSEKRALPWTPELLEIKALAEEVTGETYNSCLLNLYHDGTEGLGWHSDNEDSLVPFAAIAAVSLGAERKFVLKHRKSKESVTITLEDGSLLVMRGATQVNWVHSLPRSARVTEPRISLTFRSMK